MTNTKRSPQKLSQLTTWSTIKKTHVLFGHLVHNDQHCAGLVPLLLTGSTDNQQQEEVNCQQHFPVVVLCSFGRFPCGERFQFLGATHHHFTGEPPPAVVTQYQRHQQMPKHPPEYIISQTQSNGPHTPSLGSLPHLPANKASARFEMHL